MIEGLTTQAELRAQAAEKLPAFGGLNILHIKRQLEILLGLIGRGGIFDEYTRHDISHIDAGLKCLDWLIPETTQGIMSAADWLLTVLAVYFHDLGLLVTKAEYAARNNSGFPAYRDTVLFAEDPGADYRAKVEQLPPEEAQRFLYQEFVRHKHAERIRNWVMGRSPDHLGLTHQAMSAVDDLLKPLSPQFRRDLALVCESHHLEDIYDLKKYKVSQPYGNSDAETANVQYAAKLLRAADLLHITGDRAPSIAFRVIDPIDPISQREWAKQMAVTAVRPKMGLDREGKPDPKAPRDTIEVHAYFTKEDGFFGLTSYLKYAGSQISKCCDWVQQARKHLAASYEFPWRYIDDSNIEAEGFMRQIFAFTIDEAKILDLLTGHTLYNDTSVVLRELVQNALDAVRLQHFLDSRKNPLATTGRVKVHWDSKLRVLSVEDNGTGMTQEITERHLLKVGASRYQDPEFKKQYPEFSAISRFGIGILSTFMIADMVEIVTSHPDEEQARQLSLRSVHGRYLIKLLDKHTDQVAKRLAPRGTLVRLKVRASADMPDVVKAVEKWIVVPACEVRVSVDDAPPAQVGFVSPEEALVDALQQHGIRVDSGSSAASEGRVRVEQKEIGGVTVAYALEWSEWFREWAFLLRFRSDERERALGTCVEGVRVEFGTPGFDGQNVWAIANAAGLDAPKTNVVRSGLEATPQRDALLRAIYGMYCDHVKSEMQDLHERRGFSLTWAVQESTFLFSPLLEPGRGEWRLLDMGLMMETARGLPVLLMELDGERRAVSPEELYHYPSFWTVDCMSFASAEALIREMPVAGSLCGLMGALHARDFQFPQEPIVCGFLPSDIVHQTAFSHREVATIRVYREQRRVDLRWANTSDPPRWRAAPAFAEHLSKRNTPFGRGARSVLIAQQELEVVGLTDEIAVRAFGTTYILPKSPLAEYLTRLLGEAEAEGTIQSMEVTAVIIAFVNDFLGLRHEIDQDEILLALRHRMRDMRLSPIEQEIDLKELVELMRGPKFKVFDPSLWTRRE